MHNLGTNTFNIAQYGTFLTFLGFTGACFWGAFLCFLKSPTVEDPLELAFFVRKFE